MYPTMVRNVDKQDVVCSDDSSSQLPDLNIPGDHKE